jgi:hypothetical protein
MGKTQVRTKHNERKIMQTEEGKRNKERRKQWIDEKFCGKGKRGNENKKRENQKWKRKKGH